MAKRALPVASPAKPPKASSMVTITIKGPRGPARVMRCVIKGRRTEYACLPCGLSKGFCEFKRIVTIMCCGEGSRTVCREVPGPWSATGRTCKPKTGGSAVAVIELADGLDLVCTELSSSAVKAWCDAHPSKPARVRSLWS